MEPNNLIPIICLSGEDYTLEAPDLPIKGNQQYQVTAKVCGRKGSKYSAYLSVVIKDSKERERRRHIRWLNDFSGNHYDVTIIFTAPIEAATAIIGFRMNFEAPVRSDLELEVVRPQSIIVSEVSGVKDNYDDIEAYKVPPLPALTTDQEIQLEKRVVWIFGAPRSGTTWLGTRLLVHPQNIIWDEALLGYHLGAVYTSEDLEKNLPVVDRVIDLLENNSKYFFSIQHKDNWLPALRKFILTRIYSQAQSLTRNIIIKEPNGSYSADIIAETLPNSKIIFLMRDGRDTIESRIDITQKAWEAKRPLGIEAYNESKDNLPMSGGSSVKLPPEVLETKRYDTIKLYSVIWKIMIDSISRAYDCHNPKLRLYVKYENLKTDTYNELRTIYNFIGVQISDEQLRKIADYYDFKNIPESEKGPGKFNRAATTGGWRNTFSKREQDLMNSILGETLTKFGYSL